MHARARTGDPESSHEAAASVKEHHPKLVLYELCNLYTKGTGRMLFTQQQAVHNIRSVRGDISEAGIRSRISQLRKAGYLEWAKDEVGEQLFYTPGTGRRHRYLIATVKGQRCVLDGETPVIER
jgi:hypothetical protein